LHAVELTRRLRKRNPDTKVTINSLHPGVVNTNLIRSPVYTKFLKYAMYPFVWYFTKTESDGCQCTLFVALSPKIEGVSGKYFE
jgi:NAD(P)-dependent dehydrogenase (short-subunit alcohol dehydrogenase family)